MTWSKFDDLYDEHEKIQDAWELDRAAVGLHVMATTHCNRMLTDGVVQPRWLKRMLPSPKEHHRVLGVMVDVGLFDLLPAGQTRTVNDAEGDPVTLGPFAEDRYLVHDFLDRHESKRQVEERRARDAARKRSGRRKESGGSPSGRRAESERSPDVRAPASRPDPTRPDQKTPPPPASRGSDEPTMLRPPSKGNSRQRDLDRFRQQIGEATARLFPDHSKPEVVSRHVESAVRAGATGDDEIRRYVAIVEETGRMPLDSRRWKAAA